MRFLSRIILKMLGWQLDEQLPAINKYVLIGYPHTSNWDFIMGMLAKWAMNMPLNWVAKHSMFWGPFGPIFVAMGGVPVNRGKASGFIQKNIDLFNSRECFVLGLMPEGTRSKTDKWKTGFYHIADGANVPIALAYLDYKNKKIGVGKMVETTGDIDSDFEIIKSFYQDKTGCNPKNQSDLIIKK
ncbi:MAG: glycerol acyltransferase [endosymbiont of Galathealinum brachiosum]|uniref:Glycerol acyltransferase n=1 Tax=endosymbiont of Galathealinum brachiosum TaxID=2200906 RepID=A0A370D9M8_9GAMM|nr:MAG: glycerol acyltransferase [endosymbiont of Galathealinum brachiosum]